MSHPYSTPGPHPYGGAQQPGHRPQIAPAGPVPAGGVMGRRLPGGVRAATLTVWLDVEEVARRLNVSKMTIYRLIANKDMEAIRIGRSLRIKEEVVNLFVEHNSTYRDQD